MNESHTVAAVSEATSVLGHNSADIQVQAEVRLFNSISRYAGKEGHASTIILPAGSTVSDVLALFDIPRAKVFLVYVNGRDITPQLGDIRTTYVIEDGDVIALSGPVPYSYGYGAPIV